MKFQPYDPSEREPPDFDELARLARDGLSKGLGRPVKDWEVEMYATHLIRMVENWKWHACPTCGEPGCINAQPL